MKKIFFACLVFIGSHLSAQEWQPYWIEAIKDCYAGDYASAENHFNLTIEYMENENIIELPSAYTDRACLYMTLNQYYEALEDVNKALLSEKLEYDTRIKAVSVRIAARLNLGFSEGYEEDIKFLFRHSRLANEASEGVKVQCPTCPFNLSKQVSIAARTLVSCRLWCDDNAQTAIFGWCAFFPEQCVINACNRAVLEIQANCHLCCETIFSQDICAAPFTDIVSVMQKYLPPCGCPQ